MSMRIGIAVHGRFHAFDLARSLLERGHDVTLLTNYPRWAVDSFGFPRERTRSFWLHGVLSRAAWKLHDSHVLTYPEPRLHRSFGSWVRATLRRESFDVVHVWSGVCEETFRAPATRSALRLMMRGSSHVRAQARLLMEEEARTGAPQDRPSKWIIAREQREYALADRIVVLSTFARDTFLAEGLPADKLSVLPLGARVSRFRPPAEVAAARRNRILSGAPLRVLFVGTLCFRKGLWDLASVASGLGTERFEFRFVGPHMSEARQSIADLQGLVTFPGKQPQASLPEAYAWGDVFVFPTIEDGYAVVLAQAAAAGLPILTTSNCSGPDLLRDGESGWVVPIRSPHVIADRLRWAEVHRTEVAAMADRVYDRFQPRDWVDVARDFEQLCLDHIGKVRAERRNERRDR